MRFGAVAVYSIDKQPSVGGSTGTTSPFRATQTSSIVLGILAFLHLPLGLTASSTSTVKVEILRPPVTVLSWQTDRCQDIDIPDSPLRVYRRFDGKIVGIASHYVTRTLTASVIPNFRKRDCATSHISKGNPDPSRYDDRTWIASTWSDDGRNVAAIGHHEYHGELHTGMCAGKTPRECRYGVLMLYVSRDGGNSFVRASEKPISAAPVRYEHSQGKDVGFFQPSNIFESEGIKYVFVRTSGGGRQNPATCLMRSKNPLDASSWEIFTGKKFERSLFDPYKDNFDNNPICKQVSNLNGMVWSVVQHRQHGVFIALLTVIEPNSRGTRLATSVSKDLLTWTRPILIDGITFDWTGGCSSEPVYHYPSLIDPDAPDRNFYTTDDEALLFLTSINRKRCKMTLDRDLVYFRVRLIFE